MRSGPHNDEVCPRARDNLAAFAFRMVRINPYGKGGAGPAHSQTACDSGLGLADGWLRNAERHEHNSRPKYLGNILLLGALHDLVNGEIRLVGMFTLQQHGSNPNFIGDFNCVRADIVFILDPQDITLSS